MYRFKSGITRNLMTIFVAAGVVFSPAIQATTNSSPTKNAPIEETFRLANSGDVQAQRTLGNLFLTGKDVIQSHTEALRWYRQAAEQGDAQSQNMIGLMYIHELGVPKDFEIAIDWLRLAADQGLADAQYNLGSMYYLGEGVSRDYAEAVKWLRSAATQNHASAGNDLAWLLSTCPDNRIRNGDEAVKIIEKVINNRPTDSRFVSTLAAAYAEVGRYQEAVKVQEKAIAELKESDPLYPDYQNQLNHYKNKQPWREE